MRDTPNWGDSQAYPVLYQQEVYGKLVDVKPPAGLSPDAVPIFEHCRLPSLVYRLDHVAGTRVCVQSIPAHYETQESWADFVKRTHVSAIHAAAAKALRR